MAKKRFFIWVIAYDLWSLSGYQKRIWFYKSLNSDLPPCLCSWFYSYLSGRQQSVCVLTVIIPLCFLLSQEFLRALYTWPSSLHYSLILIRSPTLSLPFLWGYSIRRWYSHHTSCTQSQWYCLLINTDLTTLSNWFSQNLLSVNIKKN